MLEVVILLRWVNRDIECDIVDMEAYAIAKVCKKYDVNFKCFKYISDKADENAASDWKENIKKEINYFRKYFIMVNYND